MPFRPLVLAAMMVVALGYLGFLAHMNAVLTDQQIAAMRVDRVKSVHSAVTYDLELNLKHAAALAGYRVGMAGGEPGELEPLARSLLNERISLGFSYEVVRVEVPIAEDNVYSLDFREDGSYGASVGLDGVVEHVAGDVKLRGFEARGSVPARWMLLYRLVRKEHPLNVAAAEQALASGQDVGQALKQRERELNELYAGEGVEWEVSWGSVTTIARDARVGPVVIVDGRKVPMAYRMSSQVSAPQVPPPQPAGVPPQPAGVPARPSAPSRELQKAWLTVDTTTNDGSSPLFRPKFPDARPAKGEVFVNAQSWGIAPQTRELMPGTYMVGFGKVYGYDFSAIRVDGAIQWRVPVSVTLEAGDNKLVIGEYFRETVLRDRPFVVLYDTNDIPPKVRDPFTGNYVWPPEGWYPSYGAALDAADKRIRVPTSLLRREPPLRP